MLETPLSNSSEDNNNSNYLSVIGVTCGAGLFALLMIICGVSCIVVRMHHKKKENNKMDDPIYADEPQCPITSSNSNAVMLINPIHEMNTGATNGTNLDTQDHQVLHSSNYNSTTTTTATDNVNEGNIDNYALTMQPPSDEPDIVDEYHTTTCLSQFADSDEPTEEGEYATRVCPPSDVFPIADENRTTIVSCSTQAFDGFNPTGGDEYGTTSQQQNLNCYAVNQVCDAA